MNALAPATRTALSAFGYSDELILEDYRVWVGINDVVAVDGAAFAAAPTDMTTSTIVVSQVNGRPSLQRADLCHAALAMAAPVAIEADNSQLRVFAVSREAGLILVESLDLNRIEALERFQSQLGPHALLEAKLGSRQLTLFPIDVSLLKSARSSAREALTTRLDSTLRAIASVIGESTAPNESSEAISRQETLRSSRILIGALTCAYMRDKNNLEDIPADALPRIAQNRYQTYFSWLNEDPEETSLLVMAIKELSDGISFRGLAPDVVTEPYERVLVSAAERKAQGIHYTPPEIAALMLSALPIEELPPDQRHILDPTCGSGTLLLASYDRLRATESRSPFQSTEGLSIQHQRLTGQLHGFDQDPFAVQITKLALLLHDQSGGNGWNIAVRDTLSEGGLPEASVLVANPPWLFYGGRTGGNRTERANRFVHMMLDALTPNGLLGLILPSSWLTSMASKKTRERMNEECDLFEIWRLPEMVFRSSRTAPAIICGRKKLTREHGGWRVFRRVVADRNDVERFYTSGVASETFLAPSDDSLLTGPLTKFLSKKSNIIRLGDLVEVREGSTPRPWVAANAPKKTGSHLYLKSAGELSPFGDPPSDALIPVDFPADFYWNTPLNIAAAHKVLVSATRWADNPWRLKVGIDVKGIIVRNSLNAVILKSDVKLQTDQDSMLFALMALLGSGLASLWIDEHATKRSPSADTYLSLPIPSDIDWPNLANRGRKLLAEHKVPEGLRIVTKELESFIWESYKVDDGTLLKLMTRLSVKDPPEGGTRYPDFSPSPTGPTISDMDSSNGETRLGAVFDVEADSMRIWINSVTPSDGVEISVPLRFPGSLAHPDATFETDATDMDDVRTARYWLQRETWRDDDNLDEYLRT